MKLILLPPFFCLIFCVFSHAADTAFFDSKVLPILQKRCFECHSHGSKIKGGLVLDSRSGWEQGGDNGPAIKPGELESSLLIKAVRYVDAEYEMPPKG
ncbi:MAG: c-type cytochrome domain-containing protein, partial [Prosthecobacter sp.]